MSDFDDAMAAADADIFDAIGDSATITDDGTPANTWARNIVIDHDLQLIIDDALQFYGTVATIPDPPAGIASGWTVTIATGPSAGTYTLRQLIERDNWVQRWAVTEG